MEKVLIVVNPVSGGVDKTDILKMVRNALKGHHQIYELETQGEGDDVRINEQVENNKIDRVLAIGGDGTIKTIIEAIQRKSITIGIVPAGSANGFATDLGLPEASDEALRVAIGTNRKAIDVLSLNNILGLHISDVGINAELIQKYSNSAVRGYFGYVLKSIPTLMDTNLPYDFLIKCNGGEYRRRAIMVAFANSRKYGTGALVNPQGRIDDGKFEILIFKKFDVVQIINALRGTAEMTTDFVEIIQTEHAQLHSETPVSFQIDGEYHSSLQDVEVTIISKGIHVAVGA